MARSSAPNSSDLWRQVSAMDKRRVAQWNRGGEVISKAEYMAAVATGPVKSPFSAIPLAAETTQFGPRARAYEMIGFFGESLSDQDAQSMEYYSWDENGYQFANYSMQGTSSAIADDSPAPITIVPTSTTNPDRPRTVAAGYDPAQEKLTVIFRDGTYYNYYEVTQSEWTSFKNVRSKGVYIAKVLDDFKPRGVADVMTIPAFARETVYRFLRTGQKYRKGNQPGNAIYTKKPTNRSLAKSRGQSGGSGVTRPRKP